jgi:hypothetical protein
MCDGWLVARASIAFGLLVALLGGAAGPAEARRADSSGPGQYFSWSAPHRTVRLTLLAGSGSDNNGFNFDGYGRGELLVTVPVGWRVVVDCENRGSMRHSCAVVHGALASRPAFPGATSPRPLIGLSPGGRATFSFTAGHAGTFRIACLVPGHEQARMWDVLDVTHGGRPSISARPGP